MHGHAVGKGRPGYVAGVRRSPVRWLMRTALLATAAIAVLAPPADAHPLHTTLSELTVSTDGTIQIVLRAFIDDLSAAVARGSTPTGAMPALPDSAVARYLAETLMLTDASGRKAPLAVTGTRRTGDLVWVTLRAPTMRSSGGARLTNRVLFDRWDDQVNIVQTTVGSRRQTLLFTRRDGAVAKAI